MWADVMERHRSPNERAARHNGIDCGFSSLILLGPRTPPSALSAKRERSYFTDKYSAPVGALRTGASAFPA